LKDFQIDVGDCKALYSVYDKDEEIVSEIEKNPYKILIGVLKRSFENADKMILELRDDLTHSEERCSYLILSVLETNESYGNTKCNANVIYNYIIKNYTQAKDIKDLIVPTVLNNKELFYYDEETKDLAILNTYLGECQIASLSVDKNEEPHILDIDWKSYKDLDDFHLTDEQLGALENFCNYDFTILCGKSGSGKTSTMKALVKLMEDNDMSYSLLSPTGSASLRLKEQTHRPASTIHRKVLRDGKINSDVIIVDEMSMVSLDVFVMLINAISNKDCKIVLCGDDSQLPSISKGKVFNDLIESNKVPKTILTKVFRYDTNGGAFVGENIRLGRQFLNNEKVKVKGNIYNICGNYKFVQTENIFENVISEYKSLLKKYKPNEIMILSAYNIGDCGTYKLNQTIEDEYNPPKANEKTLSYKINGVKINFRVGSRVVNTKNNYNALPLDSFKEIQKSNGKLTEEDVRVTELFNGQIGVVAEVQDDYLVCQFDDELIVIDKHKLNTLLLARAISIHRSQGSEYKAVINIISPQQSRNLSKNLLYVSDTRAKEYHCDIGDRETFEKALLVDSVDTRKTWLKDLLITS
jgi:ATP-dependent exoDNAse (exonuclease V), alpha subunit - helicase superfamily I member